MHCGQGYQVCGKLSSLSWGNAGYSSCMVTLCVAESNVCAEVYGPEGLHLIVFGQKDLLACNKGQRRPPYRHSIAASNQWVGQTQYVWLCQGAVKSCKFLPPYWYE